MEETVKNKVDSILAGIKDSKYEESYDLGYVSWNDVVLNQLSKFMQITSRPINIAIHNDFDEDKAKYTAMMQRSINADCMLFDAITLAVSIIPIWNKIFVDSLKSMKLLNNFASLFDEILKDRQEDRVPDENKAKEEKPPANSIELCKRIAECTKGSIAKEMGLDAEGYILYKMLVANVLFAHIVNLLNSEANLMKIKIDKMEL